MSPDPESSQRNGTAPAAGEAGLPAGPERNERLYLLFHQALEFLPAERPGFLERSCGADASLRKDLEELLHNSEVAAAEDFLADILSGPGVQSRPPFRNEQALVGQRIGPYEVRELVASGGMGSVYRAVRIDYSQEVAIKVLRCTLATREMERRFQTERQVLANLKHPNIARLLDGGATEEGLPYLVMEYIDGEPIDRYCDSCSLPDRERVRLLVQVCEAVAYAHEQGVVHRDLKPANILVGADGAAKLTDFGLAKDLHTVGDEQTRSGQLLGTPAYMAPEQALGKRTVVGPLADVYALGAVLYHLVTGRPPFQGDSWQETLQQSVSELPVRPRRLRSSIQADLEAVCLKCLEKEPLQRYRSAGEVAEELRRFLCGEPVKARPLGSVTLAARWCRRNPVVAALVAMVGLSLVAGTAVATLFAHQAIDRANELELARQESEKHARAATRSAAEERHSRAQAERARQQAEERRQRGEWLGYIGKLASAQGAWHGNDVAGARQFLADCPAELRGWEHRYLHLLVYGQQTLLATHTGEAVKVCWSPDGKQVASGGKDGTVQLRDVSTGKLVFAEKAHDSSVTCLFFTADSRHLLTAGADAALKVWEASTGKFLARHAPGRPRSAIVAVSPDGGLLARTDEDYSITLYDVQTGKGLATLVGHAGTIHRAVFSDDGQRLVTGSGDCTMKVWNVATGMPLLTTGKRLHGAVQAVAISSDGRRLASCGADGIIRIWDAATGKETLRCLGHEGTVFCLRFTKNGRNLFSGSADRTIQVWNTETGRRARVLRGHTEMVQDLALSPDGSKLASAAADGKVQVWLWRQDQEFQRLTGHSGYINQVAISAAGNRIASASHDGTVRVWDLTPTRQRFALTGHPSHVFCVAMTADGERIASGGAEPEVRVWNVSTRRTLLLLRGHTAPVWSVAFSPDGKRVACGSEDATIRLWDTASGRELSTLRGHTKIVTSLAFSPNGGRLLSGSHDGTARIWNATEGSLLSVLPQCRLPVLGVAWSPDGKTVAAASGHPIERQTPGEVLIWRAQDGCELHCLRGHSSLVSSLCFTPDGKRILTASHDQTIRVWDTVFGSETLVLRGHGFPVSSLALSADGRFLASADRDTTDAVRPIGVQLWETAVP